MGAHRLTLGGISSSLGGRRVVVLVVAIFAVLACALQGAFSASPAFAVQTRRLVNTFGSLSNPQGLAIDQSAGDVYVADTGNNRIEKFDAEGNLLLAFGADVGGVGVDTCTLSCGPGTQGSGPGQFTTAKFVAVDNDPSSASYRDVYVADVGDNLVSKFDSSGNAIATWGNNGAGAAANGQLNGSSTTAGSFGELAGIAVDSAGSLYVLNKESHVFKFDTEGKFTSELGQTAEASESRGLGVDAAGDLFKVNPGFSVEKLDSAGKAIGRVSVGLFINPNAGANAIAVEPASGDLYTASAGQSIDHYAFNGSGRVIEPDGSTCEVSGEGCRASDSFPIGFVGSGVVVSSTTGDVFVSNPVTNQVDVFEQVTIPTVVTQAPSGVGPHTAELKGVVNPEGIELSSCEFEYGLTTSYGQSAPCSPSPAEIGKATSEVQVHADVSGLAFGTVYHYRLVAANLNGASAGADTQFETAPGPSIDSATVTSLGASSAVLNAKINPRGFAAQYHFEYDTVPYEPGQAPGAHGTRVPLQSGEDPSIEPLSSDVAVSHQIALEKADTPYYWRVVAENANGTTISPDHTFVYTTSGAGLPDNRAYEMVTPARKNGALLGAVGFGGVAEVAADGSRVIGESIQCFGGAESCNVQRVDASGTSYEFSRTSSGWVTTPLAPPAREFPSSSRWETNVETGLVLFSAPTEPFGEDDFYAPRGDGTFVDIGPVTPPEMGPVGPAGGSAVGIQQAVSADLSHIVWEVHRPYWPFDKTRTGLESAYEYVGTGNSRPLLVGVNGGQGSEDLISVCGTNLVGKQNIRTPGMMSADGRTVYFEAAGGAGCVGSGANAGIGVPAYALYARVDGERADAHTVAISARSSAECTGACLLSRAASPKFVAASVDGSKAFFLSTQQLMDRASGDASDDSARGGGCSITTGANGCNLYMYDFSNPVGHELTDVSAGDLSGGGPRVQGVMAVSTDGSHAYFIAKGVLTRSVNTQGQGAQDGANNLYVYERDAGYPSGRVAFIASLPDRDSEEWTSDLPEVNVTPDGRYLLFPSHGDLTPDDVSVSRARQVFRYDAQTGQLLRISVGNDGFNDNGNRSVPTPCQPEPSRICSENAHIPLPLTRSDPAMSDDGSYVFFQSSVALTPHALDDVKVGTVGIGVNILPWYAQNVYEWHDGHVSLISDGKDVSLNVGSECPHVGGPSSVCLFGTDASGSNVFFSTADQLVAGDSNTELDYYDARVCAPQKGDPCIESPPPPLPACLGEDCHGTPAAQPSAPASGTSTFNGQGNVFSAPGQVSLAARSLTRAQQLARTLRACRKRRNRGARAACERLARERYGPARGAKRSSAVRLSGRNGRGK